MQASNVRITCDASWLATVAFSGSKLSLATNDNRPYRRRANEEPPPMLCLAQWEAAAEIGGAHNIKELGKQFELAVKVWRLMNAATLCQTDAWRGIGKVNQKGRVMGGWREMRLGSVDDGKRGVAGRRRAGNGAVARGLRLTRWLACREQGEFVVLELDWRRKGASNAEIRKRLGKAAKVRRLAEEQQAMAESPVPSCSLLRGPRRHLCLGLTGSPCSPRWCAPSCRLVC